MAWRAVGCVLAASCLIACGDGDDSERADAADPAQLCAGRGSDLDGDDWCGVDDNCPNHANPQQLDTDRDGVGDACDPDDCNGEDDDGDGVIDNGFPDADSDGLADCVDSCPDDPDDDLDGDGICGPEDNCPAVPNVGQEDADLDNVGDACDVEVCDLIDNDGDEVIDEGVPDTDADGTCDAFDVCPADAMDDMDVDGLCADSDNCAAVFNPGQEDDDADGLGNLCDLDSPDGCDATAPLAAPGTVPLPPTLELEAIVADPVRDIIYGTVGSSDPVYGNSIVAVDAPTNSIVWTTFVGSEPQALAVSADGAVLYVDLDGAASVRVINLELRRACFTFALPPDRPFGEPLWAGDMGVLPSAPETLVISALRDSFNFHAVIVLDHGAPRPSWAGPWPGSVRAKQIAVVSDSIVCGYNDASTGFDFSRMTIGPDGVTEDWSVGDLVGGFDNDIVAADGRVYGYGGEILEPGPTPSLVGTTAGDGPAAADVSRREVYHAETATEISVYDVDTFLFIGTIAYAGTGSPEQLVLWGDDGIAVLSGSKLVILDGVRELP